MKKKKYRGQRYRVTITDKQKDEMLVAYESGDVRINANYPRPVACSVSGEQFYTETGITHITLGLNFVTCVKKRKKRRK